MTFESFKFKCPFHQISSDQIEIKSICFHIKNVPDECAWEDCKEERCPFLK